jgi:hypothetical protein
MFKKTLLGLLFTAFVAALIAGGIYRTGERTTMTAAAANHDHEAESVGHGHEARAVDHEHVATSELATTAADESDTSAPLPPPAITTATTSGDIPEVTTEAIAEPAAILSEPARLSRGNGGQSGQSQPTGSGLYGGEGQAQVDEWVVLTGEVTAATPTALTFTTMDGLPVLLEGRAWFYLQQQAFAIEAGQTVSVTGFYDQDRFEAGAVANLSTGDAEQVRDSSGRPMWAGRGGGGARDG